MSKKSFAIIVLIILLITIALFSLNKIKQDKRKSVTITDIGRDSAFFVNADTSFHYGMDSLRLIIGRQWYPKYNAVSLIQVRRILPFPCKVGDTISVDYEKAYYIVDSIRLYSEEKEE